MPRPHEHKLDRTLTTKLTSSMNCIHTSGEALAIKESTLLNCEFLYESKQFKKYDQVIKSAKKILDNNTPFNCCPVYKNPPNIVDAIKCISYILDFKVTSKKNIAQYFGSKSIKEIAKKTGIISFKDNLQLDTKKNNVTIFSDKVTLFNIALLYSVNIINASNEKKEHTIPFFILNEIYDPIIAIPFNNEDRLSFLFEIYNELHRINNQHFLFSSSLVTLYRAYEKYIVPSDLLIKELKELIKELIRIQKEYERNHHTYNDNNIKILRKHIEEIKDAQKELLFFIKDNITLWLEIEDNEISTIDYEQDKLVTLELLSDIKDAFSVDRPPQSLDADYFFSLLFHINSDIALNNITNIITSLLTIKDTYILEEFYDISFHILGKHSQQKVNVNDETLFTHLFNHSIKNDSIIMLANILCQLYDITDTDILLLETFTYSANAKSNEFYRLYNMILAYNPIS